VPADSAENWMPRRIENRTQALEFLEREQAYILPTVTEVTHRGEREWNIFSRLLKDRIVFIGTEIDDFVANAVIAQFLFLESEDPEKDIQVYINSPAASSRRASPCTTRCSTSAARSRPCASARRPRWARSCSRRATRPAVRAPHARMMIHQPLGGARGQATDIEIQAREIKKMKETLIDILVDSTGKNRDELAKDIERDFYLSAGQAKSTGSSMRSSRSARNRRPRRLDKNVCDPCSRPSRRRDFGCGPRALCVRPAARPAGDPLAARLRVVAGD
jgi:ATP-dependent Clp protease protease subunit